MNPSITIPCTPGRGSTKSRGLPRCAAFVTAFVAAYPPFPLPLSIKLYLSVPFHAHAVLLKLPTCTLHSLFACHKENGLEAGLQHAQRIARIAARHITHLKQIEA